MGTQCDAYGEARLLISTLERGKSRLRFHTGTYEDPIHAFEAFNKENSFNKSIQPSVNPIFCQQMDRVDRVQSMNQAIPHPDGRVECRPQPEATLSLSLDQDRVAKRISQTIKGAQVCAYYAQHGVCKFGPTCKFDHPMGTLSYSPSASSLVDMPVAPYPIGMSPPTLAPSFSSTELRPEFLHGKDPFLTQTPSDDVHAGSVGPLLAKGRFLPHALLKSSSQMTASTSNISKMTSSS
ncbi:hypothetical protein M5K25_000557 [Dendrobium thyrsiflorum]|uniref:C3H1-type domain-containing protein n=1 Tax=Dendrobium thyrsiflorum TaxID=117978 RepID=A0ABD0WBW2_DENTH